MGGLFSGQPAAQRAAQPAAHRAAHRAAQPAAQRAEQRGAHRAAQPDARLRCFEQESRLENPLAGSMLLDGSQAGERCVHTFAMDLAALRRPFWALDVLARLARSSFVCGAVARPSFSTEWKEGHDVYRVDLY
jgi:hypothetical protein